MVFLIVVSIYYLAYVFQRSISTTIRIIVIVGSGINQVYTHDRNTNCLATPPLIVIIALSFLRILTGKLNAWRNNRLAVSWLSFRFFFKRFEDFFFLIRSLTLLTISIYFSNTSRGLECSFKFKLDSFIEYFVSKV